MELQYDDFASGVIASITLGVDAGGMFLIIINDY